MKIKTIFITAFILLTLSIGVAQAVSVFNSNQVGTNPITGYYLETNGATSTWAAVSGGGSSTTIYAGTGILVNASGTGYLVINNGVTSFNGATGTVTYAGGGGVATTTINGGQYAVFNIVGSGAVTSTTSGATTTFSIVPGSFLTAASGTALYYPLSGNPSSFLTSATGVTTFNGASGAVTGVATNTGNWNGTWKLYNPSDFLSSSTQYVATNTGNWAGTAQGYTLGSIVTHGSGDYLLVGGTAANSTQLNGQTASYYQTALGFTPYNATNPSAFIPLTALSATGTGLNFSPHDKHYDKEYTKSHHQSITHKNNFYTSNDETLTSYHYHT